MLLLYSPIVKINLEHIKKVAKMLRKHKHLILNWFKADGRLSSGTVEWLNLNAKVTMGKAMVINHEIAGKQPCIITLGNLPEPVLTHRFCG